MIAGNKTMNSIATAYMFLDVPWYELLFVSSYESELASSMSYAFTYGIASILSTTITNNTIPADKIIKETYDIDFHEIIDLNEEKRKSNETTSTTKDNENDTDSNTDDDESNNFSSSIPLQSIFQQKVIDLYQSAKEKFLTTTTTTTTTTPTTTTR